MRVGRFLYAGLFALSSAVGMAFALLAEIQTEHNFQTSTLGLIAASGLFGGVVAQLGLAPLADRGWLRPLMVGAMVTGAVGSLGFAVATEAWQFVGFRLLSGVGLGAFFPAAQAVVVNADPARAGERLGNLSGVQVAGFIIGPGLGAVLANASNVDAPFLATGVVLLVLAPLVSRVAVSSEDPSAPPTPSAMPPKVPIRTLLRRRNALAATLLSASLFLPMGTYEAIWSRFMADLGASTLFTGITLSIYGLPFALIAPIGGRLADRHGTIPVMWASYAVICPLIAIYGQVTVPGLLATLAVIEAVGNGLGVPASQALMARATSEHERATGLGLAGAAGQVTAAFTALVSAPLYDAVGPRWMFAAVTATIVVVGGAGMVVGIKADE